MHNKDIFIFDVNNISFNIHSYLQIMSEEEGYISNTSVIRTTVHFSMTLNSNVGKYNELLNCEWNVVLKWYKQFHSSMAGVWRTLEIDEKKKMFSKATNTKIFRFSSWWMIWIFFSFLFFLDVTQSLVRQEEISNRLWKIIRAKNDKRKKKLLKIFWK